jgi:hypothetical protein
MESTTDHIYAIKSTNLTNQRVIVGQARFTLEDATAIIETANNTEDTWFYEMVFALARESRLLGLLENARARRGQAD